MLIKQRAQAGFTLLEVMIAGAIFAIGMLGVAGLHLVSLENNHAAYLRTQAVNITQDIIERMRNNPQAVSDGHFNDLIVNTANSSGFVSDTEVCETAPGCNTSALGDVDIAQWAKLITKINNDNAYQKLPQATATVKMINTDRHLFTFSVSWSVKKWQHTTDATSDKDSFKRIKQTANYTFKAVIE